MSWLQVFTAHSSNPDPVAAVAEIRDQIEPAALAVLIVFCSPAYDSQSLAAELQRHFPCPVLACTTSAPSSRSIMTAASLSTAPSTGGWSCESGRAPIC